MQSDRWACRNTPQRHFFWWRIGGTEGERAARASKWPWLIGENLLGDDIGPYPPPALPAVLAAKARMSVNGSRFVMRLDFVDVQSTRIALP
jgi:hypothetical protein